MKGKPILLLFLMGGVGLLGYVSMQALSPASRSAERKASELLKNIQIVPAVAGEAKPKEEPKEELGNPSQIETQRNHYLGAAIESLQSASNDLICARAAHYRQMALARQRKAGASPEKVLLDELQRQNAELLEVTAKKGGFNGEATSQDQGRSLVGDNLAILKALEGLYNQESRSCVSEPYQATQFVSNYLVRASQHRSALQQQAEKSKQEVAANER